ncbi:MAG: phosphoadenylyl-sulfate reductase [Pseudomonadota bacterium]
MVEYLGLRDVRVVEPDSTDLARHDPHSDLWRHEPDWCCQIRKTDPLALALEGFDAWINGRKQYQGGSRSTLPTLEADLATDRIKINPLARWSLEDVRLYRRLRNLPLHPLVTKGFSSIGCAPCTKPTANDESGRSGRWSGLDKTECGIHGANTRLPH